VGDRLHFDRDLAFAPRLANRSATIWHSEGLHHLRGRPAAFIFSFEGLGAPSPRTGDATEVCRASCLASDRQVERGEAVDVCLRGELKACVRDAGAHRYHVGRS
jgi:hypothetical protein